MANWGTTSSACTGSQATRLAIKPSCSFLFFRRSYSRWVSRRLHAPRGDVLEGERDTLSDLPDSEGSEGPSPPKANINMDERAEVFIGFRDDAETWVEDPSEPRVSVNLFNSSNQLFADYQPHNGNVFSMVDRLEYWDDEAREERVLDHARVSYHVVGWQSDTKKDMFHFDVHESGGGGGGDNNNNNKCRYTTRASRLTSKLRMRMDGWDTERQRQTVEDAAGPGEESAPQVHVRGRLGRQEAARQRPGGQGMLESDE